MENKLKLFLNKFSFDSYNFQTIIIYEYHLMNPRNQLGFKKLSQANNVVIMLLFTTVSKEPIACPCYLLYFGRNFSYKIPDVKCKSFFPRCKNQSLI